MNGRLSHLMGQFFVWRTKNGMHRLAAWSNEFGVWLDVKRLPD